MSFAKRIEWMSSIINKFAIHISVLLFVVMTLIIWVQVFYRFILGGGIAWSEEIAKYLMVWMALLGSSVLLREGKHIAINYFISKSSFLRYILIFHAILAALLFILLIYYGINYAVFGYKLISPASGIRRFWPYMSIPVGGGFLLIQTFARLVHLLLSDDNKIRSEEEARARHELLSVDE
jgi:TRAP-type transport system small permease protein